MIAAIGHSHDLDSADAIEEALAACHRRLVGQGIPLSAYDSVENAAESFALVATTEDCQEGLNAFVEKRTPVFHGR